LTKPSLTRQPVNTISGLPRSASGSAAGYFYHECTQDGEAQKPLKTKAQNGVHLFLDIVHQFLFSGIAVSKQAQ
jgi:hypothetical protein